VPDPTFAAVAALGRLDPDPVAVRDTLARLNDGRVHDGRVHDGRLDADRVLAGLELSKVGRLARHAVGAADPAPGPGRDLLDRLVAADEAEQAWRARAVPAMRAVVAAAGRHGGRVVKGLAVQSRYPRPELRHVGDVDLHFPSWAAARPMVRELRTAGWVWDTAELPWLKWHDSGQVYGQLSLVRDDNAAPYARVDLHVGPFSVGHAGLLPMVGWRSGAALGEPATVPDTVTAVAMVAAHAVVDRVLSVKDLNDLRVLLAVGGDGPVDWATVWELCRAAQATGALAQCLRVLAQVHPDLPVPRLPGGGGLSTTVPRATRRAVDFAALAYRDERARGSRLVGALRTGWTAYRYFGGDLRPRPAAGPVAASEPVPALRRRDVCWRLVPPELWARWPAAGPDRAAVAPRSERLDEGLTLVRGGGGVAVLLEDDVFVPTVWGAVPAAGLRLARRLAGADRVDA
jgi:hypothetical protein